MKKPRVATLEEVRITRDGEAAVIEFVEPGISTTHFGIGPEIQGMSDQEVLDLFNESIRAQDRLAAEFEHIAVEIPPGKPQIKYFAAGNQWVPRGDEFQRGFVWKSTQVRDLAESLWLDYPIGSLLVWNSGDRTEERVAVDAWRLSPRP